MCDNTCAEMLACFANRKTTPEPAGYRHPVRMCRGAVERREHIPIVEVIRGTQMRAKVAQRSCLTYDQVLAPRSRLARSGSSPTWIALTLQKAITATAQALSAWELHTVHNS